MSFTKSAGSAVSVASGVEMGSARVWPPPIVFSSDAPITSAPGAAAAVAAGTASRTFRSSASRSRSLMWPSNVDRRSPVARRNSPMTLPRVRARSGSFSGPNTTSATTKMITICAMLNITVFESCRLSGSFLRSTTPGTKAPDVFCSRPNKSYHLCTAEVAAAASNVLARYAIVWVQGVLLRSEE